jgi:medium-chain acyl-[acyl-carrier-protein] hydrolase
MDIPVSKNPWICPSGRNPRPRLRLYCVPHAGGGASLFRRWQSELPEDLEVCGIQLPGRENRSREPPLSDLASIVWGLGQALHPTALSGPFVLFGHSMGALIAFELVRWLQEHHRIRPVHLIVSGCNAPHVRGPKPTPADRDDAALFAELRRLRGTDPILLNNSEFVDLLLPRFRADYMAYRLYEYSDGPPLNCPITACGGIHDSDVTREGLQAWEKHTVAGFELRLFPGDHFYLTTHQHLLLSAIANVLGS